MDVHLNLQDVLALLLILGMVWRIVSQLVTASELLRKLDKRVTYIEKKIGIADD